MCFVKRVKFSICVRLYFIWTDDHYAQANSQHSTCEPCLVGVVVPQVCAPMLWEAPAFLILLKASPSGTGPATLFRTRIHVFPVAGIHIAVLGDVVP